MRENGKKEKDKRREKELIVSFEVSDLYVAVLKVFNLTLNYYKTEIEIFLRVIMIVYKLFPYFRTF